MGCLRANRGLSSGALSIHYQLLFGFHLSFLFFMFFIVSLGFHLCICVREVSRGAACLRADGDL